MLFTDLWAALSTVCQEVDKHQEGIQQLLQMQKGVYHLMTLSLSHGFALHSVEETAGCSFLCVYL
jgi:hypothetical protein